MKLKITCPNCDEQQEIDMSVEEAQTKMFSCGKCKVAADVYDAETGEPIASGAPYMPAVVVYEEKSCMQVIIPAGIRKEEVVSSLKTIADAIESGEAADGISMSEVAIALEGDRMIVMNTVLPKMEDQEEA
jgi:hypothetical protein